IVNDTLYYIVKRVKGTIDGDVCEVTDDEIVSYNFRGRLDKGIKVTSTFRKNEGDSAWYLDGSWKTNATKKYYAVTGKVSLSEEKDLTVSKLFPHLEELKLADGVAFYKERTETTPTVKVAKPEKFNTSYTVNPEILATQSGPVVVSASPTLAIAEPVVVEEEKKGVPVIKTSTDALSKTETKTISPDNNNIAPSSTSATASVIKKTVPAVRVVETPNAVSPQSVETVAVKPIVKQAAPAAATIPVSKKPETVTASVKNNQPPITNQSTNPAKPVVKAPVAQAPPTAIAKADPVKTMAPVMTAAPEIRKPAIDIIEKAAVIAGRKSEFTQVVNFRSDSLVISLYDNGEIDGDTVSVFMNGETILSKQGLKSSAIKKTIYITPGDQEDFTLVMFAESLGKYPPNTGLLVIRDGDDVYNLRFSSDFQKNAGIVFRKKK
ncbi:MAG: hypothetical protein ABL876_16765, partial [Chitinophagaceae bacterium]